MIANQEATRRDGGVSGQAVQDGASILSLAKTPTNSVEAVIAAYTAAGQGGAGARESAFDAAVGAYMTCYPETHREAAARIVANIISHRP